MDIDASPAVYEAEYQGPDDDKPEALTPQQVLELQKLASMMCNREEIAGYLGVDEDRLKPHMKNIHQGNQYGRVSIRQWQMKLAEAGNIEMLKFLGQQYLRQTAVNK